MMCVCPQCGLCGELPGLFPRASPCLSGHQVYLLGTSQGRGAPFPLGMLLAGASSFRAKARSPAAGLLW